MTTIHFIQQYQKNLSSRQSGGSVHKYLQLLTAYFIAGAFFTSLTSCGSDDFLDIQPETFTTAEDFYQTPEQIELAVNGIYGVVQQLHDQQQWAFGEFRSDNTSFQYNPGDRGRADFEAIDEFTMTSDNPNILSYWTIAYGGVSRSNQVLTNIEGVTFNDEQEQRTRTGEAQFFRAFNYFNLVRLYGEVPIITTPITVPEEAAQLDRRPVEEVYELIIQDAQDAISNLPDSYSGTDVGRITSGAARTLLAKVHMTQGNFAEAVPILQAITGYSLLPNYEQIYNPANKNHAESIFEIQYFGGNNLGEASDFMSGNFGFFPYNSGDNLVDFGSVSGLAGYNIPTSDMINAYEAGDLRRPVSVAYYTFAVDSVTNDSVPYINKYNYPLLDINREDVNWPVYRYADVLLMLAESLNEQGYPNQPAFDLLNQVRNRAGLPALTAADVDSQEAFREAIAQERRVELAFENHRWFDLLRTDRAVSVMQAHGVQQKAEKGTVSANAYTDIRTLLAIPAEEVRRWGYEQNSGWGGE